MNRFTRAIAMASARHPWRTLASWLVVLTAVMLLAVSGGGSFADDFSAKGSESDRARQLLNQSFPEAAKGNALVVFAAPDGASLADVRSEMTDVMDEVTALNHVESLTDPFIAGTVSEDGRIAYAVLTLDVPELSLIHI